MNQVQEILRLFKVRGQDAYLGEPVSQAEHALQAAHLAEREGATDALVVAALLHDAGHLLHKLGEDVADRGIDSRHEIAGAEWLALNFGEEVAEPARLHVDAKRYLCAIESAYLDQLSSASKQSLALQGGPMSPAEVDQFASTPYHREALRLRRWDDEAKIPGLAVPDLEHYLDRLVATLKPEKKLP